LIGHLIGNALSQRLVHEGGMHAVNAQRRVEYELLCRFMREAPAQPATNLWRAIELPVLAKAMPQAGRGLDVGCGDGVLTGVLCDLLSRSGPDPAKRPEWDLVGIDPDAAETNLAQQTGSYTAVFTTGATSLPFPESSFDFVFANSVLEHIADLPGSLMEIGRCLRPGGVLLATVPAPEMHDCLAGPGWIWPMPRQQYLRELDRRLVHLQYWSIEQWREQLGRAGLLLESAEAYLLQKQMRRWELWSNWTGGLLYRLWGRKKKPIAIQRALHMRRGLPRFLHFLAPLLASLVGRGVLGLSVAPGDRCGCVLVRARKRLPVPSEQPQKSEIKSQKWLTSDF
jgi:SAM-dependent methyltransferase